MKAQLSLELLILTALSLAMLSVSIATLSSLVSRAGEKISQTDAQNALSSIAFSADDVCTMGEGNRRIVETPLEKFRLKYEEENLSLYYKNSLASKKARCKVQVDETQIFQKAAAITYEDGTVLIAPPGQ